MRTKKKVFIAKFDEIRGKDQKKKKRMKKVLQCLNNIREFLVFISKNARISTTSGIKTKKKIFIQTYSRIFMKSGVKPQKQTVFIAKSTKKRFLLTNSGLITSSLGVSGFEMHSSSTEPVNFLGAQSSLRGAQFSCGAQFSFGRHGPRMLPCVAPA